MGNGRLTIWVMVCVMLFGRLTDVSASSFDEGETYNIDWNIIRDMHWGGSDIVNLLPGGSISGTVGMSGEALLNISGGSISAYVYAYDNSRVTMSNGSIAGNVRAFDASQVTMTGGSMGTDVDAYADSQVSIAGGVIGRDLRAFESSQVTMTGGSIEGDIRVDGSSNATFAGSDFTINGSNVAYGEYDTVGQSGMQGTLTGTLASGDPLDNVFTIYADAIIMLAPGPSVEYPYCTGAIIGDLNDDCQVDFADLAMMVDNWMTCNLEPQFACWD